LAAASSADISEAYERRRDTSADCGRREAAEDDADADADAEDEGKDEVSAALPREDAEEDEAEAEAEEEKDDDDDKAEEVAANEDETEVECPADVDGRAATLVLPTPLLYGGLLSNASKPPPPIIALEAMRPPADMPAIPPLLPPVRMPPALPLPLLGRARASDPVSEPVSGALDLAGARYDAEEDEDEEDEDEEERGTPRYEVDDDGRSLAVPPMPLRPN
jgi:hypothetical protein